MISKLNELKKEIQRLRPEIMELKQGCGIKASTYRGLFNKETRMRGFVIGYAKDFDKFVVFLYGAGLLSYKESDLESLGRPITLEDVLFCCVEAYSKFGIVTRTSYESMFGGVVGNWDFTKDFDNQSEEFYDEIGFLLEK